VPVCLYTRPGLCLVGGTGRLLYFNVMPSLLFHMWLFRWFCPLFFARSISSSVSRVMPTWFSATIHLPTLRGGFAPTTAFVTARGTGFALFNLPMHCSHGLFSTYLLWAENAIFLPAFRLFFGDMPAAPRAGARRHRLPCLPAMFTGDALPLRRY